MVIVSVLRAFLSLFLTVSRFNHWLGVPFIRWFGTECDYNVMVLALVGPPLEVAIKLKSVKAKHPQLKYESKAYKTLAGSIGVPFVQWFGTE
jgi:hypothetical protein